MFGVKDHVISAAKSQAVVDVFKGSQDPASHVHTLIHSQGHVIPKCDAALAQYHSFLTQNLPGLSVSGAASPSASSSVGSTSSTPNQQQADKPLVVGQKEELYL